MTKYFNPAEIAPDNAHGYRVREVVETMRHYGFIVSYSGKSHIQFRHRDYKPLFSLLAEEGLNGENCTLFSDARRFIIPNHPGEVQPVFVQKAAAACLKVKELNHRLRAAEELESLPEWVEPALRQYFEGRNIDLTSEDNEIRLSREPQGDVRRSYRITCQDKVLNVVNNNFPEEFSFTFNLHKQSNPEEAFQRVFSGWDESVKAYIQLRSENYLKQIDDLEQSLGFVVKRDAKSNDELPLLCFSHPAMRDLAFELPVIDSFETIPQESIDKLSEVQSEAYTRCEQMSELLAALHADTEFELEQAKSNKNKQVMRITHTPDKKSAQFVLYGELESFALDEVRAFVDQCRNVALSAAPVPETMVRKPETHTPPSAERPSPQRIAGQR